MVLGLPQVAAPRVGDAELEMDGGGVGHALQSPAVMGDRRGAVVAEQQHVAEILMGGAVVRRQVQGVAQRRFGLVQPPELAQGAAQVVQSLGVVRA